MSRLLVLLCALRALAAQPSIAGQEAVRARILLASPSLSEKAWGAYFAGRLHSDDLRPVLLEQLRTAASQSSAVFPSEPHLFVSVLLDAAVEARLDPSAVDIEPFLAQWPVPALILLSRAADAEESLLRLADTKSPSVSWLAANNLLYEKKSRPWYRNLTADLAITHRFIVTDPGSGGGTGVGFGCGGCGAGPSLPLPTAFPPIARYTMSQRAVAGSVLLAPGPHNVYYTRTILPAEKPLGFGECSESINQATVRDDYLVPLSGLSENEVKASLHGETAIQYRTREEFEQTVQQSLALQENRLREIFQLIAQRSIPIPPGMQLRIAVEIFDLRGHPPDPLLSVPPRDIAWN